MVNFRVNIRPITKFRSKNIIYYLINEIPRYILYFNFKTNYEHIF